MMSVVSGKGSMLLQWKRVLRYCADAAMIVNGANETVLLRNGTAMG